MSFLLYFQLKSSKMHPTYNKIRDIMRFFLSAIITIWLATGCSSVRSIQVPSSETQGEWVSEVAKDTPKTPNPSRMYVRKKEAKYIIKDEPYSIASKKKDPELLGPQRTYNADSSSTNTQKVEQKRKKVAKMTKESCINLIGEEKYNKYVQRYGGETGALRRCLVLKRLRG